MSLTRRVRWTLVVVSLAAPILFGQEKGGGDETGAYEVVAGWPQRLPDHDGWVSAPVTAIFADDEVPSNQVQFIELNALYFQDKETARAKVNELKPAE